MPSPPVGRDAELAGLAWSLAAARDGRGEAVLVVGEAGIGKSRLAAELVVSAERAGMAVLSGRASAVGPASRCRPVAEALLSLSRAGGLPDPAVLGAYAAAAGALLPEWAVPVSSGCSPVVLAEAVLRVLAAVGRDRGCLLLLEDLHVADPETAAVVEYLCDNLADQPVALVGTLRPEPDATPALARAVADRDAARLLRLGRLAPAEVDLLAAGRLGGDPPPGLAEVLAAADGSPVAVLELLAALVESGRLVLAPGGWSLLHGELVVPAATEARIGRAVDRLGPAGGALLAAGAAIGGRFPLSAAQRVASVSDAVLPGCLRAAAAAGLLAVRGDDAWFRDPLTAAAVRGRLTAARRRELARRAAEVVAEQHPDLPGPWRELAADLLLAADSPDAAAGVLVRAARSRPVAEAVALLERAEAVLPPDPPPARLAEVWAALLPLLTDAGRAAEAASRAAAVAGAALPAPSRPALHAALARALLAVGDQDAAADQLRTARALLGPAPSPAVDAAAAELALSRPGGLSEAVALASSVLGRKPGAVHGLAHRPAAGSGRPAPVLVHGRGRGPAPRQPGHGLVPAPRRSGDAVDAEAVCSAWRVLERAARGREPAEADRCVDGMRAAAVLGRLPVRRAAAEVAAATATWLADGDADPLRRALADALAAGAAAVGQEAAEVLALDVALRGDAPDEAVAALLAEDGTTARAVLAALDDEPPTWPGVHLTGRHGLARLLRALDGEPDTPAGAAAGFRWNRQFDRFATAVRRGRAGRPDEADRAAEEAERDAAPYPLARHLAYRLVAADAYADGWGRPVEWLRRAEEHFHDLDVPAARECRALLRRMGAAAPQRRADSARIPAGLRLLGVTPREHDVLRLVGLRFGNKAIGTELHISPRTVEKHVASLTSKTRLPDRDALIAFARDAGL